MEETPTQETGRFKVAIGLAVLAAVVIAAVSFGIALYAYRNNFAGGPSGDQAVWGQFGDYLGGVLNPVFGFFSFLAILLALVLQSRELHLSTRELAKSAEALERQHSAIIHQNFENTFFQMLRRFGDVVSAVRCHARTGREAFYALYDEQLRLQRYQPYVEDNLTARAIGAYERFYSEWHHELGHYFRTLYHIFTFIDRSHLTEDEKSVYANIVRAQLSTYELCLLFYNGIVGEGKEGFRPLIEKYGILKHIYRLALLSPDDLTNRDFYSPTAFMGKEERKAYRQQAPGS